MAMYYEHLRRALSRPPLGVPPRKPTSVPPMTLYARLKYAQDRLRAPKPSLMDRLRHMTPDTAATIVVFGLIWAIAAVSVVVGLTR